VDKQVYKANALLMITAVIWGSAFVAQRVGMNYVGPYTFNGLRFALGTLVLLPFALMQKKSRVEERGDTAGFPVSTIALVGGILAGLALFSGASLQQIGLIYTTAGKAAFITGLYVIIVPLMGLFLGQRPSWGGWIGACLASAGLYLLSITETFTFAPGDLWELFGAFFWAAHIIILNYISPKVNAIVLACIQYIVVSVLSLFVALFTESLTLACLYKVFIPILYLGIFSVGIAYTLQVVAQRFAPPTHAAIILSLETVFAALSGWIMLGEILSPRDLAGCALMLSGMIAAQLW
jgi:drug/metabolite transporter (DMT)-like permease